MTVRIDGFGLDNLYKMVAYVYHEKNERRSLEATFAHFVEICGLLAESDPTVKEDHKETIDRLCKALGWFFPLLAKARVASAEQLIFRKFPQVCPYCRKSPHIQEGCKNTEYGSNKVDFDELQTFFDNGWPKRPRPLDAWMNMFQNIYPRKLGAPGQSVAKLLEELGELAEAVRVLDNHPNYFFSEAADIFSYLMGIGNEILVNSKSISKNGPSFSLNKEFILRYPGKCGRCKSDICVCPHLPLDTVGRIAKEIPIREGESLFSSKRNLYDEGSVQADKIKHVVAEIGPLPN